MNKKISKLFAFGIVLVLLLSGTVGTALALSNSGGEDWNYYREITVKENSGKTLSDYQVLVELSSSNFPSKAKSDGSDLRFEKDGEELSYWIEDYDAGAKAAKIWVKVPSIPTSGEAKIKMYYGNPSAGAASDGDATFEFFDDFDGTSLDSNKWNSPHTVDEGTSVSIHDGLLDFDVKSGYAHTGGCIISKTTLPSADYISETKVKFTNYYRSAFGAYAGFTNAISYDDSHYGNPTKVVSATLWDYYDKGNYLRLTASDIGGASGTAPITIRNLWFKMKTSYTPSTYATGTWIQLESPFDERTLEKSGTEGIAPTYVAVGIGDYNTNEHTYFDFVFVRKYASPEPTFSLSAEFPVVSTALTITKTASPHSIKQEQKTTVKITVENTGTTTIRDIEVVDTPSNDFDYVKGETSSKYADLKSGESRSFQYTIESIDAGKFDLGQATATYAEGEGNYHTVESNSPMVDVLAPLEAPEISAGEEGEGEEETPGFEAVFAITGLLAVAYLVRRIRK